MYNAQINFAACANYVCSSILDLDCGALSTIRNTVKYFFGLNLRVSLMITWSPSLQSFNSS